MKITVSSLAWCAVGFSLISPKAISAANYSSTVLADGPIAYYRFSDSVTTPVLDLAQNSGSLGTAGNGIYSAVHPVAGALVGSTDSAARASGGQNISIPYQSGLNVSGAFTVEAWLRPAVAITDPAVLTCALSSVQVTSPRSGWLIYQTSTGWNFRTYNQNTTATAVNITGGGTLTTGTWYHVVCVWNGSTGQIFVNGAAGATSSPTNYVPSPNTPFTMGMRSAGDFFWAGDIDEVAYYGAALSGIQIAAHYANGVDPAPVVSYGTTILADSPVGYWRLNEPAYVAPTAANSGSMGAAANGRYLGGAIDGAEAPRPPQFFGFEADNTALQLDGINDFVSTISGLLNGKPRFSLTGWIRRGADQANRTGLFGQNDIVEFGYINNNTLECWTDNGLDISPNPFPNGEWAHIALVSEGSPGTLTMYTNGVKAGSRTSVLPADNTFPFNIGGGGIFDGSGNFFNGQMDEVAVFDKALSAAQVANEYFSTVAQSPKITRQPQGTNLFEGGTINLSVDAAGSPDLQYQWLYFGSDLQDQTNSTLIITNAQLFDSGSYSVRVANNFGSIESDVVDVNVLPLSPPSITQDPTPVSRYLGAPRATFTVSATGGGLRYQWQKEGTDMLGETNSTLVISNIQSTDAALYQVTVSNDAGSTTSSPAELTILNPAAGSYEAAVVAAGPAAYWRLDESSGTVAHDNWGGFDGTYLGGVTLGVPGALVGDTDTAAQFDGTSGYVGTPLSLNGQPNVTLLGWMRRGGNQLDRTGLWGQNDLIEFGYIDNNTIQAWVDNFDAAVNVSPNPIPNLEWAQLALVVNSGVQTVYVNGSAAGTATLPSADYGVTDFKFNIAGGGIFDASGNFFLGRVDDVAVYNRALSSSELCSLYLKGSGTPVELQIDPTGNFVLDTKPFGTPHPGHNFGAEWAASDTDPVPVTRSGVMKFVATEGDQIKVDADPDFNATSGTIMLWVRSAGVTGPGDFGAMLVDRRGSAGDVIVQTTTGNIFVQASGGANSFQTTRSINDGHWHHITYVYDQSPGGSTSLYIDGTLDSSQVNSAAWSWQANEPIELGRSHDSFWYAFDGLMDDVRVYNTPLSAGQIAQVYDGEGATLVGASAMVLRLNFDAAPSGVTIRWPCGVLQQASELIGDGPGTDWQDVLGANPPYTILPNSPAKFFRLRQ